MIVMMIMMIMVMIIINDDDNNESNDNDDDDDNSDENDDNSDDNVNNNATWLTCEIQGMFDLHDNSYKMPCHESICAEVHYHFIPLSSVHHILKHDTKIFYMRQCKNTAKEIKATSK